MNNLALKKEKEINYLPIINMALLALKRRPIKTILNGRSWTDSPIHMQPRADRKQHEKVSIGQALAIIGMTVNDDDKKHIVNRYRNALLYYEIAGLDEKDELEKTKDELKKRIPSVCFSGQFKGSRAKANFIPESCTNIFVIDIDKLNRNVVANKKEKLAMLPFVRFVFVSPSENGLKVGLHVPTFKNDDDIKIIFEHVASYFKDNLDITIDQACKDVSRLCFLSIDKDIRINEYASMMDIDMKPKPVKNTVQIVGKVKSSFDNEFEVFPQAKADQADQAGNIVGNSNVVPFNNSNRKDSYVKNGLDKELQTLINAPKGGRNNQLNISGISMFGMAYINGHEAMYPEIREQLLSAALQIGLKQEEALTTINSAFNSKEKTTRKPYEAIAKTKLVANSGSATQSNVAHINESHNNDENQTNEGAGEEFGELVKEMNKEYSVINMGGKSRVAKFMNDGTISFQAFQDFKNFLLNKTETVISGKKHNKITHANIYLASPLRKEYMQGIEFFPTTGDPDRKNGKLNTWSGFGYKRKTYDINRIKIFLDYIENVVCGGNAEYAQYLMGWIARGFQKPHLQAEIAVVLRGEEGSGKSTLGLVLSLIWGNSGMVIESAEHLTGKFNDHLMNCAFLAGNEAVFHGDKKSQARLKAMVTDPSLIIEKKGVDAFKIRNCMKIVISANDDFVVQLSAEQRRFFCLDVVDNFESKKHHTEFYNQLYKIIGEDETARDHEAFSMILDYFLSYDLTGFEHRNFPNTEANKNQRAHSLDLIPRFLIEVCERGSLFIDNSMYANEFMTASKWHERVHASVIKQALDEWGRNNYTSTYDKVTYIGLKKYLYKLGLENKNTKSTASLVNHKLEIKQNRGWFLGSPEELLKKVMVAENITDYFKGDNVIEKKAMIAENQNNADTDDNEIDW